MAIDLGEADAMMTSCERNGVKLIIAYQRPHHATWLAARDLIRQGAIGTVCQLQMDDGGNLLNTNSHNIRLVLFLLGAPSVEWVLGAVERTTDGVERGLPAERGSDGVMELDTTHPADAEIPSDAPMYMP
jgi:predicted dehydrogenase